MPNFMDEPFTGLDTDTRQRVIRYILKNRRNRILLVATHGEDDAALLGAQIIRLEECQNAEALQNQESIQKGMYQEAKQSMQETLAGRLMTEWKVPIMNRIPQEEWDCVLGGLQGEKKCYERGEILWKPGDTVSALPVLLKGCVAAYLVNEKGQESEVGRFQEGNCFGEMLAVQAIPSPVVVKALEKSEVKYLSMDCLISKGYDSEQELTNLLLWEIIYNMADKIGIVTDKLNLMSGTIDERILTYLRKMPEVGDGCRILDRNLTELAQYFQIPKQSLSRKLTVMEEKGLIRRIGLKEIQILNESGKSPASVMKSNKQ